MEGTQKFHESSGFKGNFSFVNKTSHNIESNDHQATVSWHLAHRYNRWRKHAAPKTAEETHLNCIFPVFAVTNQHHKHTIVSQAPQSPSFERSHDTQTLASLSEEQANRKELSLEDAHSAAWLSDPVVVPSPEYRPQVQPSTFVKDIINFGRQVLLPTIWPSESTNVFELSCAQDDLALIGKEPFFSNASMYFLINICAPLLRSDWISQQAGHFQKEACLVLSARTGPASRSDLQGILKMFSAETASGGSTTARGYMRMLRTLVVAQGGTTSLGIWLLQSIVSADCYFALKHKTRPLFPAAEWMPGNMVGTGRSAEETLQKRKRQIPAVIEHAILRNVLVDVHELLELEQHLMMKEVSYDNMILRWKYLRRISCLNRVADHHVCIDLFPHLYAQPKLHLAICTAIVLMIAMVFGCPEPVATGLTLVQELRVAVEEAQAEIENGDFNRKDKTAFQPIFLWLLYMGTLGSKVHPVDDKDWFTARFEAKSEELGLDLLARKKILLQFLYSPRLEEEIRLESYRKSDDVKGFFESSGTSWRQS